MFETGVIILAGGKSKRMGKPKAMLQFGDEFLLQRMVRRLATLGSPIIVVAAKNQTLPALPDNVVIAVDAHPDCGPLEGLRAGLQAMQENVAWAFATGCDLPFLSPQLAQRLAEGLSSTTEIAAPKMNNEIYPLPALYQTALLPRVESLCQSQCFRMKGLLETSNTKLVEIESPGSNQLGDLFNVNTPEQLTAALLQIESV